MGGIRREKSWSGAGDVEEKRAKTNLTNMKGPLIVKIVIGYLISS
jgi:hypothetical protein